MNIKAIAATAALCTGLIAGAAGAQTVNPANTGVNHVMQRDHLRGERGSARNLWAVRRQLERSIDQLQRDRHDYGGHRVQAIELMQQARNQIVAAEQYDRQHPGE